MGTLRFGHPTSAIGPKKRRSPFRSSVERTVRPRPKRAAASSRVHSSKHSTLTDLGGELAGILLFQPIVGTAAELCGYPWVVREVWWGRASGGSWRADRLA